MNIEPVLSLELEIKIAWRVNITETENEKLETREVSEI